MMHIMTRILLAVMLAVAFAPAAFAQSDLKSKISLAKLFTDITAPASGSTVRIRCDGKDAALGTVIDSKGRYTYVVASESQKSSVAKWKSTTFVPTSVKTPRAREILIFRNMLSSQSFAQSALNAPQNNSATGAAAAMGAYYPVAVSCPVKYYLKFGPSRCFGKYL